MKTAPLYYTYKCTIFHRVSGESDGTGTFNETLNQLKFTIRIKKILPYLFLG